MSQAAADTAPEIAAAAPNEVASELKAANERLILATLQARELADEAAQAEALFNALPDVVARYDRQFRHLYVNTAVERVTGVPRSDFLGRTTAEVGLYQGHLEDWNGILADSFDRGCSVERFFTVDLRDGRRVLHVRTIPELDATGAVMSVLTIARDVTESAQYRAARADADRLRRIQAVTAAFSSAPTPRDVAHVLATQALEALEAEGALVMLLDEIGQKLELASGVGYPPEVLQKWHELPLGMAAPLPEVVRTGAPLFFSTHDQVLERYPALAHERHGEDEALAAVPLTFNGRSFGAVALVFRRAREFAASDRAFILNLAQHSAQAIDRARLLDAEREARRDAEAANRLKDDFLATMSHELRTPLNAVMGWATLLRAGAADPTTTARGIDAIERNARVQARLIEDVLDVSRIISGKLELDLATVDVASVVSSAVDVLRAAADAKRVSVQVAFEDVCVIPADPGRLQQVVWNLVSNAIKFTPERGRVDVAVRRRGERVVIEVRDTGEGIPSDFLPRVFDRFRQLDGSITRRQGGLGLGLAIVRHLVELHGGTVAASSEGPDRGACFTVELPGACAIPAPPPSERNTSSPNVFRDTASALDGVRVLVVDDDEDARVFLSAALERCGAEVSCASSAADALAQTAVRPPDALVCDIGMPGTDGYTLMRHVRALPAGAGGTIPAVAVTGFARPEDERRALDAGFQEHIAKPVDLRRLIAVLARLVCPESAPFPIET